MTYYNMEDWKSILNSSVTQSVYFGIQFIRNVAILYIHMISHHHVSGNDLQASILKERECKNKVQIMSKSCS